MKLLGYKTSYLSIILGICSLPVSADVEFEPYELIHTEVKPDVIEVLDLNQDGLEDIVFTINGAAAGSEYDPYHLGVVYQMEFGVFSPPEFYLSMGTTADVYSSITKGDFNSDGLQDIAVEYRGNIQIYTQHPEGGLQFEQQFSANNSDIISAVDADNDGTTDLAGLGWRNEGLGIFHQENGLLNAAPTMFSASYGGYNDLAVADLNGDHADDIVVMSGQSYSIDHLSIFLSDGLGSYSLPLIRDLGIDENTNAVAVGDVDNNGYNDIIVSYGGNNPYSHIGIFYQFPEGIANEAVSFPCYDNPEDVLVEDVNGDGLADIVVGHTGWSSIGVFEQDSILGIQTEKLFGVPYGPRSSPQKLNTGDINNDGVSDLILSDWEAGIFVLKGIGNQSPIAEAGDPQLARQGQEIVLDGSSSFDPEGASLSYLWTQDSGPIVGITNETSATPSLTIPKLTNNVSTVAFFKLLVTDDSGLTDEDIVAVTISYNELPVANAGNNIAVKKGQPVTLNGSASFDSDGSIVFYAWQQVSGPLVSLQFDGTSPQANFVAPRRFSGKQTALSFELQVTDDSGYTHTDQVQVIVRK